MLVTYALSTGVYLHILIVLFRIVPGFLSGLLRVPFGLTPILGGTLRCHDTWLFALAFGHVPFDIIKYQGSTPQGCQVLITRKNPWKFDTILHAIAYDMQNVNPCIFFASSMW